MALSPPQPSAEEVLNEVAEFTQAKSGLFIELNDMLNNTMQAWQDGSPALFDRLNMLRECTRWIREMKAQLPQAQSQHEPTVNLTLPQQTAFVGLADHLGEVVPPSPVLSSPVPPTSVLPSSEAQVQTQQQQAQGSEDLQVEQSAEHVEVLTQGQVIMQAEVFHYATAVANDFNTVCLAFHMKSKAFGTQICEYAKRKSGIGQHKQPKFTLKYQSKFTCTVDLERGKVVITAIELDVTALCSTWFQELKNQEFTVELDTRVSDVTIAGIFATGTNAAAGSVKTCLMAMPDDGVVINLAEGVFSVTLTHLMVRGQRKNGTKLVCISNGLRKIKVTQVVAPQQRAATATLNAPAPARLAHYKPHWRAFADCVRQNSLSVTAHDHFSETGMNNGDLKRFVRQNWYSFKITKGSGEVEWAAVCSIRGGTIMVNAYTGVIYHAGPGGNEPIQWPEDEESYKS